MTVPEIEKELSIVYNQIEICNNLYYDYDNGVIYNDGVESDWDIRTGATKLVVLMDNKAYKTPVTHIVYKGEPIYDDDGEFIEYAEDIEENEYDYCSQELDLYNKAVVEGVEDAFAEVSYFGKVNGLYVYEAERAKPFQDLCEEGYSSDYVFSITDSISTNKEFSCEIPSYIWASFVEHYGLEFCSKLSKFIDETGINDICERNCGMIDGRPVFIDYSGFYDNY